MHTEVDSVATSYLNPDAPILPGVGAGGFCVGARLFELPREVLARFSIVERCVNPCLPNAVTTLYRSESVTLFVENRVLHQVAVHGGYRGKLFDVIGIGSAVSAVEARIGHVVEDDEDSLSIA